MGWQGSRLRSTTETQGFDFGDRGEEYLTGVVLSMAAGPEGDGVDGGASAASSRLGWGTTRAAHSRGGAR
jgi:hypothetical protein